MPCADAVPAVGPMGLIFISGIRCAGSTACSSRSPERRVARTLMRADGEIVRLSLIRHVKVRPAGDSVTQVPRSRLPRYAVRRTRPGALGTVVMTSMRPKSITRGRETLAATTSDLNPSLAPDPLMELGPGPPVELSNGLEAETVPTLDVDGSSGAGSAVGTGLIVMVRSSLTARSSCRRAVRVTVSSAGGLGGAV